MKQINLLSIILAILFFAGCTRIPTNYPKVQSTAFKDHSATSIGKMFDQEAAKHPGKSGFNIIRYGREAFTSRIAMTEMAEKSLDLQYYIWEPDETGRLLAHYVLKAADRGVKVRILMDDIGLAVRDEMVASMDAHPNIEIRIFNPFSVRTFHGLNFLFDFERVNHRMHNKTFLMDNALVVIGGRNIGNHYFGVDDEMNFRDLDVFAVGPIVREVSTVYDYFWNGRWSVPIKALVDKKYTQTDLKNARAVTTQKIAKDHYPYALSSDVKKLRSQMKTVRKNLVWAPGQYVWDDPKQMNLDESQQQGTMLHKLQSKLKTVKKSLTIESPYFIPRDKGTETLKAMVKRGIKVRILTNSQSSNDVGAAFAGYANHRKKLVQDGTEMYELRPDAGGNLIINKKTKLDKVTSGLHAKALVFDAKTAFIGSFNLDPRSAAINTEGGLYIDSPAIARKVLDFMDEGVKPENAYRVTLDKNGNLVWIAETKGKKEVYHSDPHTSVWDRFTAMVLQALPIEDQL